jgi:hypothetical protein
MLIKTYTVKLEVRTYLCEGSAMSLRPHKVTLAKELSCFRVRFMCRVRVRGVCRGQQYHRFRESYPLSLHADTTDVELLTATGMAGNLRGVCGTVKPGRPAATGLHARLAPSLPSHARRHLPPCQGHRLNELGDTPVHCIHMSMAMASSALPPWILDHWRANIISMRRCTNNPGEAINCHAQTNRTTITIGLLT